MEEDLYAFLDSDNSDNDNTHNQEIHGQFSKYRAVEIHSAEPLFLLSTQSSHKNAEHDANPFLSTKEVILSVPKLEISMKCPENPSRVSHSNSFYTKEQNFENIRTLIEKALLKAENDYDCSFFPAECMVRVIQFFY
jgi:hypothetical protein